MEPTQELLHRLFTYDPSHPLAFRWKDRWSPMSARVKIGEIAGYWHSVGGGSPMQQRYLRFGPFARVPLARMVWLYHHGQMPPLAFGPKPDNPEDFRIENLICNPKRPSPGALREARAGYLAKRRASMTAEEWAARIRRRRLRQAYGITPERYAEMLAGQDGRCAICRLPETMMRHGKVEGLAIDHCHGGNGVRGLLCHQCNNGLGRFSDDPARLRAAAEYLELHQASLLKGGAG